ncbi:type II secretion system protein N [Candidatus Methylocalor cossyra]|uniref:Type II secretion system protein GspC N-terminal domain-containing protein n=1 Tax=Candidatus Methylocalor cossyra TaxID=3108543 RepID=A0ABM9NKN1_9GAMM
MARRSRDALWAALLAGMALVLSLALGVEWIVLDQGRKQLLEPPPPKAAPADDGEPEEEEEPEFPALDDFEQMVERPLFMENRRPGEEVVETPTAPAPQTPLNLKLMGVVFTPRGEKALLLDAKGKYKRLKLKDTLDNWTLVELGKDRVTLQQGEERKELPLLKKRPKPPPAPAQPSPPGAPPKPPQATPQPIPPPAPAPEEPAEDSADSDDDTADEPMDADDAP